MRCQQLEYEEQVEKGILKRQLESAIRERREAEKKYEELLEKLRPVSHINQKADIQSEIDTSLPELNSTSDSGDETEKEEKRKAWAETIPRRPNSQGSPKNKKDIKEYIL